MGLARLVRATFLSLKEKEFVEAARAAGSGNARIMLRHVLPGAVGPIVVQASLLVAASIITEQPMALSVEPVAACHESRWPPSITTSPALSLPGISAITL